MDKENKVYQLAIQFTQYDSSNKSRLQRKLPHIIPQVQKQQCCNSQQNAKLINIFQNQDQSKQRLRKLDQMKPYAIVGKDLVKSYQSKLTKKKSPTRKSESFIEYSVRSSTVRSRQQNSKSQYRQFLTKDAVLKQVSEKENLKPLKKKKIKDRLDHYMKQWDQAKMNSKGFKSIYQQVDEHRKAAETKALLSLHQHKNNISNRLWQLNLRKCVTLKKMFDQKLQETIHRNGLALKSHDKMMKQMNWVNTKQGYVFSKLDAPKQIGQSTLKQSASYILESRLLGSPRA